MIPIDAVDFSFIAAAADQLHPTQRPVFAERVRALLQDIVDPGPGDIDRALCAQRCKASGSRRRRHLASARGGRGHRSRSARREGGVSLLSGCFPARGVGA